MADIIDTLERNVSENFTVSMCGAVASGKSSYLTALHEGLRYTNAGIPIKRGRFKGKVNMRNHRLLSERKRRGILRLSATDEADELSLYCIKQGDIIRFSIKAPGSHRNAEKLDCDEEAIFYTFDLAFGRFIMDKLSEKHAVFPLFDEYINIDPSCSDRESIREYFRSSFNGPWVAYDMIEKFGRADLSDLVVEDMLAFGLPNRIREAKGWSRALWLTAYDTKPEYIPYEGELLSEITESLVDSHSYVRSQVSQGKKVFGFGTRLAQVYGTFPREHMKIIETWQMYVNRLIHLYNRYLSLHDITDHVQQKIEIVGQDGLEIPLYLIDSAIKNKKPVIEATHSALSRVLEDKGINTESFKLITFSKAKSDMTVHYEATGL